jgi:hypothetical protein
MRRIFHHLPLILIILALAACNILPAQGEESEALPTRLTLPTATVPVQSFSASAAPQQAAWFFNPDDRTILGIDPATNTVVVKVLTTFNPYLVSVYKDTVWAVETVDENITSLICLDIPSQSITENIPINYGKVTSISASDRYVWLTTQESNTDSPDLKGGVVQVDIASHSIYRYFHTGSYPLQVVADGQVAWVLEQAVLTTYFDRIDAASGQIATLPGIVQNSEEDLLFFSRFAIHSTGIWAIPEQAHAAYVFLVDPQTGKIKDKIAVGSSAEEHPIDIVSTNSALYLALQNNSIVAFSPQQRAVGDPIPISAPITALTASDGASWAWSYITSNVFHINPTENQLAGEINLGSTPMPTSKPTVYPTIPIIGVNKPCDGVDFESDLRPGVRAIVNPDPPIPNRVRTKPSKTAPVVDVANPNHWVDILEGPACADGRVWWRVHTQNNLYGWTPEGDGIEHWLILLDQTTPTPTH